MHLTAQPAAHQKHSWLAEQGRAGGLEALLIVWTDLLSYEIDI